ncbi:4 nitrophenylphosphatase [Echinococcus multilocularis]|uniref:4 nitrophenylphosphatase n=1 Tax=Echinococcus multilocularis TaxID=6211 RepID=A0A068YEU9_ECHMU|nr:4 nitrophenylphosphatase [Echinococcus multilocularis]
MLKTYKTFLFDGDGTLWDPAGVIDGAANFLQYLKQTGRGVLLVTNNSTKSVEKYLEKCNKLGLPLEASEIVCSANITATSLAKQDSKGPYYVIGQSGLGEELDKVGIEHFGIGPDSTPLDEFDISGVIIGFDSHFNYVKLMKATSYIVRGAPFYATNEDALLPCSEYSMPGTGSIVASVRKASGVEPIVFGKPSKTVWEFVKGKYGAEEKTTMLVGDRLDTDIHLGRVSGLCTACVMSGVTSEAILAAARADPAKATLLAPDLVYPSVLEMHQQLLEEDKRQGTPHLNSILKN